MRKIPGECIWPHHVDTPIFVYDRESFNKYGSGEYKVPERCVCGAKIIYNKPISICLVEKGELEGSMILEVEYPLDYMKINLSDEVNSPECKLDKIVEAQHRGEKTK